MYCTNNLEGSPHKTHPKRGKDKQDPYLYRPISLLSCVGKLLEGIINKGSHGILKQTSVLAPTQTGYRQFRSIEDQLALLTYDIEHAFQEKKKVLTVFFHLSKAFDKSLERGAAAKASACACTWQNVQWLSDVRFNRTARVKLDGMISRQVRLREGVRQGGVVLPTVFLVYVNDITTTVPKMCHLTCR